MDRTPAIYLTAANVSHLSLHAIHIDSSFPIMDKLLTAHMTQYQLFPNESEILRLLTFGYFIHSGGWMG
jgi:hypothetical protein